MNYTSGSPGLLADSLEALYCLTRFRLPGLSRLGEFGTALEERLDSYPNRSLGAYFPDGNAGIARLLVSHLIPETVDARDMNSIVDARFDYARLDEGKSPVRLRLNSTVVHVKEKNGGHPVEVTYVRGGKAQQVKARHCVLACYNRVIPYLCPELPEPQKEALADGVKVPLISSTVMLRTGDPLLDMNSAYFYSPTHTHNETMGIGRKLGSYNDTLEPGQPTALFMIGAFLKPHTGLAPREQFRAGRARLLSTSFETLALEIKTHLSEMLAPGGFDADRDIVGLTINRWPHGYSYVYRSNFDPDYPAGEAPHEIGRQRFGNIAIANSDAGANPMANEAVDQAYRAVHELL